MNYRSLLRIRFLSKSGFALFFLLNFIVMLPGSLAWADTNPNSYTHCYVDLSGEPGQQETINWTTFVASIRNAAGHPLTQGGYTTQSRGGDGDVAGGLIVATINYANAQLTLFISPRDLYLRGVANTYGQLFWFNDNNLGSSTYNMWSAIVQNNATSYIPGVTIIDDGAGPGPGNGVWNLGMNSNYNSMAAANNGNGRETLYLSYSNFTDAFFNLAYLSQNDTINDRAHLARSLLIMIQLTSEAARFNDVLGTARSIMAGNTQVGLPLFQQYLENDWSSMSQYGWNTIGGQSYSQTFNGINPDTGNGTIYGTGEPYTLNSYTGLLRFVAMLLYQSQVDNPDLGGNSGDWNHDEL